MYVYVPEIRIIWKKFLHRARVCVTIYAEWGAVVLNYRGANVRGCMQHHAGKVALAILYALLLPYSYYKEVCFQILRSQLNL